MLRTPPCAKLAATSRGVCSKTTMEGEPPRLPASPPRGRPAGDTRLAGLCSPGPAQFRGWPALPRAGPVTPVRASWLPCSAA